MLVPSWPRPGKIVFDHPLAERFCHHHGIIAQARKRFGPRPISFGGCRNDAVDHRRWARTFFLEPAHKLGRMTMEICDHQSLKLRAISREIVATHQRQAGGSGVTPLPECFRQIGIHRTTIRNIKVNCAVGRAAIAFFGDSEADDMGRWIGQGSDKPVAFLRSDDHICNRTDDADLTAVCALFDERIEAILRTHLVAHIGGTQRHPQDAPIATF